MNDEKTRVLIIEDHAVVRAGLRELLENQPELEVVGDVGRWEDAIPIIEDRAPNVVLLDLVLDGQPEAGLEALRQIKALSPYTYIVVLSAYADDYLVFPALRAGATGYMLKRSALEDVLEAVREAARGNCHLDKHILGKVIQRATTGANPDAPKAQSLTRREKEVARCLAQGMTNAEIAAALSVSKATVKTHVGNILQKLQVTARDQVPLKLVEQGIQPLSPG
jgi:NarL family two-component system response regulator LiaR